MRGNKLPTLLLLLLFITSALSITGCGNTKKPAIVTLEHRQTSSDNHTTEYKLYKKDFLYEIWQVEKEGNRFEDYYRENLGISYWDYEYEGSTMRQQAKVSVLAEIVMHEILYDQAIQHSVRLAKEEVDKNRQMLKDIYSDNSEQALSKIGLTNKVLTASLNKIALADKYKHMLCKQLDVDEAAIRSSIDRADYSSKEQYEQAVTEAIASETDLKFEPIYNQLKSEYVITINYDYWNTLTLGTITQ